MARKPGIAEGSWARLAFGVILAALAARLAVNALGLVPVHFDEAQYWSWGEAPALGYYSKPPLVAWVIRAATELLGDTPFALRLPAALCHAGIAWAIFLAGRTLFDARTGFWAAAGYTLAPGVTASAGLMTTDPPMMLAWASALAVLARILAAKPRKGAPEPTGAWALLGLLLGLGTLAKYTMLVFAAGGLGHALLSRAGPLRLRGPAVALAAGLLVLLPHLVWLAHHGFPSVAHLSENADQGAGFTPGGLPEFLASQAAVIGPVFLLGFAALLWQRSRWRGDWRQRLLLWLSAPLLLAMCVQALLGGANANWAAPSWIAGSLLAAHWLLGRKWLAGLRLQLWTGVAAALLLWGLSALYDGWGAGLPRLADPWKKMRIAGPFCEAVIGAMEATGVETILSDDRRRLAECSWQAGLGPDRIRVWNPDGSVRNHYEMVASLSPASDPGPMLFVLLNRDGAREAARFARAEPVDAGEFATHADRTDSYAIWRVEGFRGY